MTATLLLLWLVSALVCVTVRGALASPRRQRYRAHQNRTERQP